MEVALIYEHPHYPPYISHKSSPGRDGSNPLEEGMAELAELQSHCLGRFALG
jgi:hypothetical protein